MERTPGALFNTREMVAGDRLRYSPRVRRLMGCPGWGSAPDLARLAMHSFCNTPGPICDVFSMVFVFHSGKRGRPWRPVLHLSRAMQCSAEEDLQMPLMRGIAKLTPIAELSCGRLEIWSLTRADSEDVLLRDQNEDQVK